MLSDWAPGAAAGAREPAGRLHSGPGRAGGRSAGGDAQGPRRFTELAVLQPVGSAKAPAHDDRCPLQRSACGVPLTAAVHGALPLRVRCSCTQAALSKRTGPRTGASFAHGSSLGVRGPSLFTAAQWCMNGARTDRSRRNHLHHLGCDSASDIFANILAASHCLIPQCSAMMQHYG